MNNNPWIIIPKPDPTAKLRLFCIPNEGSSAEIFRAWTEHLLPSGINPLPPGIEVCSIQPPGRGRRIRETPFTKMQPLVESLSQALRPLLDKPFALFGHGMGALIGFELARHHRREQLPLPLQLFVSGQTPPQTPKGNSPIYNLPDDEFKARLLIEGRVPKEVLEHEELIQLVLPMLRADFELLETYSYKPESPLACPVKAFGSERDVREQLEEWREQTSTAFALVTLPGVQHTLQDGVRPLLERFRDDLISLMHSDSI